MADWKSIGAGLGAGLTTFGAAYGNELNREEALKQQNIENVRADERLAETKKMNDSLLQQRATQAKLAKFEFNIKKAAETHKQMTSSIAAVGYAPRQTTEILSNNHPSKIVWKFNDADSTADMYHMTRGTYEMDGDKPVLKDGEKVFEPLPGLAAKWEGTPKEFVSEVNKVLNPLHMQSMQQKEDVQNMQLEFYKKQHKWAMENSQEYKNKWYETPAGRLEKEQKEANLANTKKSTEVMGVPKVKSPAATWQGIGSGKPIELTSQEVETAKQNHRQLKDVDGYEKSTMQEVWRVTQLKENPKAVDKLNGQVQDVLTNSMSEADYLAQAKELRIPRQFLIDLLEDARENPDEFGEDSGVPSPKKGKGSKAVGVLKWVNKFLNPAQWAAQTNQK